jgi:hypothetical protein
MMFKKKGKDGKLFDLPKINLDDGVAKSAWKFPKLNWKVRGTLVLIFLLGVGYVSLATLRAVSGFYDENKIVFHPILTVRVSPPFTIERRSNEIVSPLPAIAPTPTAVPKKEISNSIEKLVEFVRLAESSGGKAKSGLHLSCREIGRTNEYGYRRAERFCFNSEEEAAATVADWFQRSLKVRGVAESLCRYNTGYAVPDCKYAKSYENYLASGKI